jgi:hypothetical protein
MRAPAGTYTRARRRQCKGLHLLSGHTFIATLFGHAEQLAANTRLGPPRMPETIASRSWFAVDSRRPLRPAQEDPVSARRLNKHWHAKRGLGADARQYVSTQPADYQAPQRRSRLTMAIGSEHQEPGAELPDPPAYGPTWLLATPVHAPLAAGAAVAGGAAMAGPRLRQSPHRRPPAKPRARKHQVNKPQPTRR